MNPEIEQRAAQYNALMAEVKARLQWLQMKIASVQLETNKAHRFIDGESCILQIRYICELIALSSTLTHHSLGLNKDLLKEYHAEKVLRRLSKLNPEFYPKRFTTRNNGKPPLTFVLLEDTLSRDGLVKIYNECGKMLHRGIGKDILVNKMRVYELDTIASWARSIGHQVSNHVIHVTRHKFMFQTVLQTRDNNVQTTIIVRD
jgi:hypothetical protein